MKPSHWLDIDDNSQTNPDSAARTRFLYLALNDVAGFEREVLREEDGGSQDQSS
jgi:hypothetical protein